MGVNLIELPSVSAQITNQISKYEDTSAIKAYIRLNSIVFSTTRDSAEKPLAMRIPIYANRERYLVEYRLKGMQLCFEFPGYPETYYWFSHTGQPNYWLDIESGASKMLSVPWQTSYSAALDWKALTEWERLYPQMRKEYLAYLKVQPATDQYTKNANESRENYFYVCEIADFLKLSLNLEYRQNKKLDLKRLRQLFIPATDILRYNDEYKSQNVLMVMDNDFIARYKEYGLTTKDVKDFINSFKNTTNKGLLNWIIQRNSLFALMEQPFQLKHVAIDGREIDIKKMKGKVVLVDFWATSCSSCIARMPAIKEVYDKYKTQGFEVISLCWNYGDELEAVKAVEKKIGTDWPILMIGTDNKSEIKKSLGQQIWDKYGFFGVPQLLLLNKQGKLVLLNDVLRYGDFEPIVKKLLAEN